MSNAMPTTTETTSTMIRISHTVWLEPEVVTGRSGVIRRRRQRDQEETPFTIQLAVDTKTPS